jgi:putative ABC transport system permease protein
MRIVDGAFRDMHQSLRRLMRERSFTITALLILALGIGANTAIFSVANSVLLKPLAYAEPERLYVVEEIIPQFVDRFPVVPANARHFLEWRRRCTCFEDVALVEREESNLTGVGEPERLAAARVTTNFFSVLGVAAQVGRTFVEADAEEGDTVLLSDALWRSRFGASPEIVGRRIELDGVSHIIAGVLPPSFRHHPNAERRTGRRDRVDVYRSWRIDEERTPWAGDHNYSAVARLPVGKSAEQALAELNVVQAAIAERFEGPAESLTLLGHLTPLHEQVVASGRAGIELLLAAVAILLVMACLNLGGLMLIRALARGREMAIRAALGASGARIAAIAFVESLLIASGGMLLGLLVAHELVDAFRALAPVDLPRADEVVMDRRALAFALLLALAAALAVGLAPAWRLVRADPQDSLGTGGRSRTDAARAGLREAFVAAEVALSVVLLIVAGLLVASYVKLNAVVRGYDTQNLLTAELSLPPAKYFNAEQRRTFYRTLVDELAAQPGVVAAGITSALPLGGADPWQDIVTIEGDTRPLGERPLMRYRTVSPDYLRTMGIAVRSGRQIRENDYTQRVAVVSRTAAALLWPGEDPVGKRFRRGVPPEQQFEVIGMADDVPTESLDRSPPPVLYVSLWERSPQMSSIAVRTAFDPALAEGLLREGVKSVDADVPVSRVRTMAEIESRSTAQRRLQTLLVAAFATCGLALAAIGLYGVVAYSITRRTNEIGLRMALGARSGDILRLVLRQSGRPLVIGLGAGIVSALVAGRFISALLFAVEATDVVTFGTVASLVVIVALAASWLPARRAAAIAPLEALRHE